MPNLQEIEAVQQVIARTISQGVQIQVTVTTSSALRLLLIHGAVWLLRIAGGFNNITLVDKQEEPQP